MGYPCAPGPVLTIRVDQDGISPIEKQQRRNEYFQHELFTLWDIDGSGRIDIQELKQVLNNIPFSASKHGHKTIVKWFDRVLCLGEAKMGFSKETFSSMMAELSRNLSDDEFEQFLSCITTLLEDLGDQRKKDYWRLFKKWDFNKNGVIDFEELGVVIDTTTAYKKTKALRKNARKWKNSFANDGMISGKSLLLNDFQGFMGEITGHMDTSQFKCAMEQFHGRLDLLLRTAKQFGVPIGEITDIQVEGTAVTLIQNMVRGFRARRELKRRKNLRRLDGLGAPPTQPQANNGLLGGSVPHRGRRPSAVAAAPEELDAENSEMLGDLFGPTYSKHRRPTAVIAIPESLEEEGSHPPKSRTAALNRRPSMAVKAVASLEMDESALKIQGQWRMREARKAVSVRKTQKKEQKLTHRVLACSNELFPLWDIDGSGLIELGELQQVLSKLPVVKSKKYNHTVAKWFGRAIGVAEAGFTVTQFGKMLSELSASLTDEEFDVFKSDILKVLEGIHSESQNLRKKAYWRLFRKWDFNKNQQIDFEELALVVDTSEAFKRSKTMRKNAMKWRTTFKHQSGNLLHGQSLSLNDFQVMMTELLGKCSEEQFQEAIQQFHGKLNMLLNTAKRFNRGSIAKLTSDEIEELAASLIQRILRGFRARRRVDDIKLEKKVEKEMQRKLARKPSTYMLSVKSLEEEEELADDEVEEVELPESARRKESTAQTRTDVLLRKQGPTWAFSSDADANDAFPEPTSVESPKTATSQPQKAVSIVPIPSPPSLSKEERAGLKASPPPIPPSARFERAVVSPPSKPKTNNPRNQKVPLLDCPDQPEERKSSLPHITTKDVPIRTVTVEDYNDDLRDSRHAVRHALDGVHYVDIIQFCGLTRSLDTVDAICQALCELLLVRVDLPHSQYKFFDDVRSKLTTNYSAFLSSLFNLAPSHITAKTSQRAAELIAPFNPLSLINFSRFASVLCEWVRAVINYCAVWQPSWGVSFDRVVPRSSSQNLSPRPPAKKGQSSSSLIPLPSKSPRIPQPNVTPRITNKSCLIVDDEEIERLFDAMDEDQDGLISKTEFRDLFNELNFFGDAEPSSAEVLMAKYNFFGSDDKLSREEFSLLMLKMAQF